MRRALTSCFTLLTLLTCSARCQFHLEIEKTLLPNGLTLMTCVDTASLTVSYQTFVDAGSRDETRAGATGIAFLVERSMYRGTERFPHYSRAVDSVGAMSTSYTTMDYTCYVVNVSSESLREVIELESDRIRNLKMTRQDYRESLQLVREERKKSDDDPFGYAYEELYRLAYKKHTYHHPVVGWERDLDKTLTFDDVEVFTRVFYRPSYCTIVISGNFDPGMAGEWVFQYYGDWEPSLPPTSQVTVEPKQNKRWRRDLEWKGGSVAPRMLIGYKGPDLNLNKPDLPALQVISNALFSGNGKVPAALSDFGIAGEISAHFEGAKDPGLFVVDVMLADTLHFDSVLAIVDRETASLANSSISEEELADAVNSLKLDFLRSLVTPFGIAKCIGYFHVVGGDFNMMFDYYDMLDRISPADLARSAQTHLLPDNSTVITLSPTQADSGHGN